MSIEKCPRRLAAAGPPAWHIAETAATDWLKPNPRSPQRADSATWIGEVLDEPHTRALLDSILAALRRALPHAR